MPWNRREGSNSGQLTERFREKIARTAEDIGWEERKAGLAQQEAVMIQASTTEEEGGPEVINDTATGETPTIPLVVEGEKPRTPRKVYFPTPNNTTSGTWECAR